MGEREDDVWIWKLNWRRPSFVWKEELHNRLLAVLDSAIISTEVDSWEYQLDKGGMYSVKVNYLYLCHLFYSSSTSSLDVSRRCLVAGIWESWTPLKVVFFFWQALLGRLPTRGNLANIGVLPLGGQEGCPFCNHAFESEDHLFLLCPFAWDIWLEMYNWFGLLEVLPNSIGNLFMSFFGAFKNKKALKKIVMLWQAVIWVIWLTRNDTIFTYKVQYIKVAVERIKCIF
jgi:hypothetical protein